MHLIARHRRVRRARTIGTAVLGVAVMLSAAGCAPSTHGSAPTNGASPSSPPSGTSSAPSSTPSSTPDPVAGLTLEQQVGELFMVGTTATAAEAVSMSAISSRHVGGIFLSGRSTAGVAATAAVVSKFRTLVNANSTGNLPLLVSTDQEGGQVQVLRGAGFSAMPGLGQGAMTTSALASSAGTWGRQLAAAGVNMNLAPVVDLVISPSAAAHNPPIGVFQREYGYSAPVIESHAAAFREGMSSAGILTVAKHFPGLGSVTQNTDTHSGVTDTAVRSTGANIGIYRSLIAGGVSTIMVSSAVYQRIDPSAPAVFSHEVVTDLLRGQLGFDGVIMSDDLSGATQVVAWSPANRAILSIEAGVDIVLVSKDPSVAAQMVDAVLAKARTNPSFAAEVTAAARRVVELKKTLR